jgi:hypothetical protein
MAKFELNIYGENDAIIKTFSTDHVRWGLLVSALKLQDEIRDVDPESQMQAISEFAKEIFVGMTDDDLRNADSMDVLNVFRQVGNMANKIRGSKNA